MKIDYEQIKPYLEKKLISEQSHPENEDVRIFNYTQKCQFDREWDDVTRQCRGLIMNGKTGEILARPFPKFFNYAEHVQNNWPIPNDTPIITEKLDGSLGIMYTLNGRTQIATRGSFVSEQAIWATQWWKENKGDEPYGSEITYIFEIIAPWNRIVVNYDFSGLVHLASINTETGLQVDSIMPVAKVKTIAVNDVQELMKLDEPNSEGFVIFYPKENVRMKIKFPEYVRLHKIVTGISEIGVWEMLRDGSDFAPLMEKVPDEFFNWLEGVKKDLTEKYNKIKNHAAAQYGGLMMDLGMAMEIPTRKDRALEIKKMDNPSIGFALLDGKDPDKIIWKMIRPHGQRVFKNDIDL